MQIEFKSPLLGGDARRAEGAKTESKIKSSSQNYEGAKTRGQD